MMTTTAAQSTVTTFEGLKNAVGSCTAECVIEIGANFTWSAQLTIQGSQRVTLRGVIAGGGRPTLDAKASDGRRRQHLLVNRAVLNLDNVQLSGGYNAVRCIGKVVCVNVALVLWLVCKAAHINCGGMWWIFEG